MYWRELSKYKNKTKKKTAHIPTGECGMNTSTMLMFKLRAWAL